MTAITVTAAQVKRIYPQNDVVLAVKLAETVTAGQIAYQTTSGTFGLADANAAGKQQARGVFLEGGAANAWVPMLVRGFCAGFTVSSMNGDALIYVSDTAGAADTATGTLEVHIGRVTLLPTGDKCAYFDFDWTTVWA